MSLKVGKSYFLDNKQYDILSELPSGTFKSTYIAMDKHNDTKVVIAESRESGKLLEGKKFKRILKYLKGEKGEIECNSRIICPIAIIENGKYIITNYFEGIDLFDYIGKYIVEKRFIPMDDVHKIMTNCVKAMIDLHDKLHFVHLDIKPENIMLNQKTKDIGIIDLGEGCSIDDILEDCDFGPSKGTNGYMSPEIMFEIDKVKYSKDLMRSSDVYSMGCVFYELLYLRRPFDWIQQLDMSTKDGIKYHIKKGKGFDFMYQINKNRDTNLIGRFSSKMMKEFDPDYEALKFLDKLVSKMLEPDATKRITFIQLQEELDKFLPKEEGSSSRLKKTKAVERLDSLEENEDSSSSSLGYGLKKTKAVDRLDLLEENEDTSSFSLGSGLKKSKAVENLDSLGDDSEDASSSFGLSSGLLKKSKALESLNLLNESESESETEIEQIGGEGETPEIFKLISEKNDEKLQKLLNREPLQMYEFMNIGSNRFTTIEWAVQNNCIECIKIILEVYELFKNDTILRFNSDIRLLGQPVHLAVKNGNRDIIHFLITNGFSINKLNRMGFSPLHIAVMENNLRMVNLLIRYSAVIDIYSKDERSPLSMAIDNKAFDIAQILINFGADIDDDLSIERKDFKDPDIKNFFNKIDFMKVKSKEKKSIQKIDSRNRRYRRELYRRMCENLTAAVPEYVIKKVSKELRIDISNLKREEVCDRMLRNVLFKELINV